MNVEVIATMLVSVNAATEGFKRIISRYNIDEQSKSTLYFLFALLAGLGVSFATNAAPELFARTLLAEYPLIGNTLLGLTLGYGSKATYFLMDLISNLRELSQGYTQPAGQVVHVDSSGGSVTFEAPVIKERIEPENVETAG